MIRQSATSPCHVLWWAHEKNPRGPHFENQLPEVLLRRDKTAPRHRCGGLVIVDEDGTARCTGCEKTPTPKGQALTRFMLVEQGCFAVSCDCGGDCCQNCPCKPGEDGQPLVLSGNPDEEDEHSHFDSYLLAHHYASSADWRVTADGHAYDPVCLTPFPVIDAWPVDPGGHEKRLAAARLADLGIARK